MISVITCSVDAALYEKFSVSVQETIGVPFEIIKVDNTANDFKSLSRAYNFGVQKAQYQLLCFIHEDVLFKTHGWGGLLSQHLNDKTVGLLGLIGSKFKTSTVSYWMQPEVDGINYNRYHFIQSFKYIKRKSEERVSNPLNEIITDAACVDGFFLACRRDVFEKNPFDEALGFHGYDFDLSMRIGSHLRVVVGLDILVEHGSEGKPNEDWFGSYIHLHWKYRQQLPRIVSGCSLNADQIRQVEIDQSRYFKRQLIQVVMQPLLLFKLLFLITLIETNEMPFCNLVKCGWFNFKLWLHVLIKKPDRVP